MVLISGKHRPLWEDGGNSFLPIFYQPDKGSPTRFTSVMVYG